MPRRKTLKLSTPADIRRSIARVGNMILNGEIDPKRGIGQFETVYKTMKDIGNAVGKVVE